MKPNTKFSKPRFLPVKPLNNYMFNDGYILLRDFNHRQYAYKTMGAGEASITL